MSGYFPGQDTGQFYQSSVRDVIPNWNADAGVAPDFYTAGTVPTGGQELPLALPQPAFYQTSLVPLQAQAFAEVPALGNLDVNHGVYNSWNIPNLDSFKWQQAAVDPQKINKPYLPDGGPTAGSLIEPVGKVASPAFYSATTWDGVQV